MHGACLLYLLALVFILAQTEHNARQFLTFFYPELGKPPEANDLIYAAGKSDHKYAVTKMVSKSIYADCRVHTPELPNKFAHVTSAWEDIFIGLHL